MNLKYKIIKSESDNVINSAINEYEYNSSTTVSTFLIDIFNSEDPFIKGKYGNEIEYVIIKDRVYWGIDISECRLEDYLKAYPQDVIEVYVDAGLGCDVLTIVKEIYNIINYLIALDWVHKKIIKFRCYLLCRKLRKRNGEYIFSSTFIDFIQSREQWKLSELMRILNVKDETLLRHILYFYGYIAQGNDLFVYDKETYLNNLDAFNKSNINSDNE